MLFDRIESRQLIKKGWSCDKKYRVSIDGTDYLLRIAPQENYEKCRRQFENMQRVQRLGIPMNDPIEFGRCSEGVYTILRFIDGQDAEEYISALSRHQQYAYGLEAGHILARIHTIPAPADAQDWESRFNRKIDRKIAMYQACHLKYNGGDAFLEYLASNRHLLKNRPQSYQHGDYHIGNMMIDRDGTLTIIDFEKDDHGDPWEEFNRIVWSAQAAPAFASGMVDGYFCGEIPQEFWDLLALYFCSNALGSLPWAIPFGDREIQVMLAQGAQILRWYDNMRTTLPAWYKEGKV